MGVIYFKSCPRRPSEDICRLQHSMELPTCEIHWKGVTNWEIKSHTNTPCRNAIRIHRIHSTGNIQVKSLSCVWLFVTPWTVACQAPLSMGFSRQEHWSGLPFSSPIFKEPMKTPQQRRGQLGYLFSLLSILWTSLWVKEQLRKMGESAKKSRCWLHLLFKGRL